MTFTFTQARELKPEQVNPFANLISHSLHNYGQGMRAAYLPQEIEANIFAKKLGPLSALATSPMFLQNPQFQAALGQLISKNLNFGGKEFQGNTANASGLPTYADQAGMDAEEAGNLANELTSAGKVKTTISGFGAGIQDWLGNIGKHLVQSLSGHTGGLGNPDLAEKSNRYETILKTLKNNAIQSQRLNAADAEQVFAKRENETPQAQFERIKRTVPNLFEQGQTTDYGDKQDENNHDNQDLRFAMHLSDLIRERTGKDVSENLIFNYMKEHPGKIHMPSLLKATGAK